MQARGVGVSTVCTVAVCAALVAGCAGAGSPPGSHTRGAIPPGYGRVVIAVAWPQAQPGVRSSALPPGAARVLVTINGPGMDEIRIELRRSDATDGVSEVEVFVPSGPDRVFVAIVYDDDNNELTRAETTTDIRAGATNVVYLRIVGPSELQLAVEGPFPPTGNLDARIGGSSPDFGRLEVPSGADWPDSGRIEVPIDGSSPGDGRIYARVSAPFQDLGRVDADITGDFPGPGYIEVVIEGVRQHDPSGW